MSIWGKLTGAAAGLAVGGPIGALLGGVAGHIADRATEHPEEKEARDQLAFTAGVVALGAKMAKADGHVSKDEIDAFREVFKVQDADAKNVARLFNLAKQDVAGYDAYADQLAQIFRDNPQMLQDVLEGLVSYRPCRSGPASRQKKNFFQMWRSVLVLRKISLETSSHAMS